MSPRSDWTLHLVRRDGLESHTLRLGRKRALVLVVFAGLALTAGGFGLGLAWAGRTESAALASLGERVDSLTAERRAVSEVADRLSRMEERYRRLQGALTAGRPAPDPSPTLPAEAAGLIGARASEPAVPAWPLSQRGFITRAFASPGSSPQGGHTGVDIAVPTGSYVRAILAGRVEEAGEDTVYGKYVRIAHAGGLTSLYGHNAWLFASPGDSVERLQVIALSGDTGRSTAPHLHLEVARDGSLLDPLEQVSEGGTPGEELRRP